MPTTTMMTGILSETENEFDRVARDMCFYAQLEQEQIEIEQYVNECIIVASGNKRAINEMTVLHEAALGDKIKGFFTKIKNFFKKIFDKLGAAINGVIIEQKKYIEKYQYIITKCKYQAGDVNDVYNHFLGISRIVDAADNADTSIIGRNAERYCEGGTNDERLIDMNQYQSADAIMKLDIDKEYPTIKPEEQKKQAFEAFLKESYWTGIDGFKTENDANGNVDPTATFKAYFNGSYDTVSWSIDEVENNMNTIINTVYAGEAYMKKLEKIVASVNKKTDEMQKKMEDYYKAQKDKIVTSAKSDTSSATNDGNDDAVKKAQKKGETAAANIKQSTSSMDSVGTKPNSPKMDSVESKPGNNSMPSVTTNTNSSYQYTSGTPVVEMNIGSSSNGNTENKGDNRSGAGGKELTGASDANKKIQDKTVATQQAKDNNMNKTGVTDNNQLAEKTEKLINRDIERRQALVNADVMISTTIANQMFAAFKLCNNDFFAIIKAHVQWYLGNPGAEKQTDNQAGRPRQLDMTATVGGIKRTSGNATT